MKETPLKESFLFHLLMNDIKMERIKIDSQSAYKIIATNSLYQGKVIIICVYQDKTAFELTFTGTEDEHLKNSKIVEEIISSFRFNDFKTEDTKKETKLVQGRKLTLEEALADAQYLFEQLEEVHPNLYNHYSKEEAHKYYHQIIEEISQKIEISTLELYQLLAPYVASFKDGHTSLEIYKEYTNYPKQVGKIFPLDVIIKGDQLFVANNFGETRISVGIEIFSINGVSVVGVDVDQLKLTLGEDQVLDAVLEITKNR